MERLTTNKEVSEMNMIELAYNSCYAKDKVARYRDYETDIDARELAIKLLEEHADIPNEFTSDEDFDDFMLDSLQYGTGDILGLIAVFYRNLYAMADLRERLKKYEDLDEQGKLYRGWIPCSERLPETDDYILVSFDNFTLADIGRYETDEEGGAFYPGDDDKSYVSYGLFVNAWQPLPGPYKPEEEKLGE